MAKNLIPEIAHMLGVELGEEFLPYMTEDEKTFQFKGRYNYASNEY